MRRHMSKDAVHPDHWPKLSEKTKQFINADEYAFHLFMMMQDTAETAMEWYDRAENDKGITRWVPQDGGGDCFLIYPADDAAHQYHGMYDALMLYAKMTGHDDVWYELGEHRDAFLWLDVREYE